MLGGAGGARAAAAARTARRWPPLLALLAGVQAAPACTCMTASACVPAGELHWSTAWAQRVPPKNFAPRCRLPPRPPLQVGLASPGDARLQSVRGGEGTDLAPGDKPAGGDDYPQVRRGLQRAGVVGVGGRGITSARHWGALLGACLVPAHLWQQSRSCAVRLGGVHHGSASASPRWSSGLGQRARAQHGQRPRTLSADAQLTRRPPRFAPGIHCRRRAPRATGALACPRRQQSWISCTSQFAGTLGAATYLVGS